jgi:uncharacterized protein (TIGR03083 family)
MRERRRGAQESSRSAGADAHELPRNVARGPVVTDEHGGVDIAAVAAEELDGLDPYDQLDAEARRIAAFARGLDEAGWAAPTRCAGWSRRDLIAHLAATEEYHRACLDDTLGALLERSAAAGAADVHGFNALGIEQRADRSAEEVVDEWEAANAVSRADFRTRDGGVMSTMAGQYPVRWQAFHVASELATHADDLGVPVPENAAGDRIAWRAHFSRFALAEVRGEVDVDLDAVDDDVIVAGVAGRLSPGHPLADVLTTMP